MWYSVSNGTSSSIFELSAKTWRIRPRSTAGNRRETFLRWLRFLELSSKVRLGAVLQGTKSFQVPRAQLLSGLWIICGRRGWHWGKAVLSDKIANASSVVEASGETEQPLLAGTPKDTAMFVYCPFLRNFQILAHFFPSLRIWFSAIGFCNAGFRLTGFKLVVRTCPLTHGSHQAHYTNLMAICKSDITFLK